MGMAATELFLVPIASTQPVPAVFTGPAQAGKRFWEFFTTQIVNGNIGKSQYSGVCHLRLLWSWHIWTNSLLAGSREGVVVTQSR